MTLIMMTLLSGHEAPTNDQQLSHHKAVDASRMSLDYCNALPLTSTDDVVTDEGIYAVQR